MSTLLVVTGASCGLGRAIAVQFCRSLSVKESLRAVLLSRSRDQLRETETEMKQYQNAETFSVRSEAVDLSALSTLEKTIEPILEEEAQRFLISPRSSSHTVTNPQNHRAILINCAGSTGYIGPFPSLIDIQEAVNLNFISKTWLSTQFARHFLNSGINIDEIPAETKKKYSAVECTIVNITSMCAVKPTPTMALYCATSAARDIYHSTLAKDCSHYTTAHNSEVRILNYAPGSCNTDMQARLRTEEPLLNSTVRAYCQSLEDDGGLVDCEDTAKELVDRVLKNNDADFSNGERIEYTDVSTYNY
mmetsp:Transcript_28465/g.43479  ORF Transcript_28465/g.43479 Transcript_28465/m.43479 type:complete len:305 (+) Transcript_28465:206-1120(+)|eukprot:CAMPEP_0194229626 /NCGR_PEP_ID=MMETSP0156-20130528/43990_1 /TAXON_ID=33649 /ORGANISM="Thalassionema nitzschioides, Strain L26-B" /LENGTH=304 /DNA_ID=CAMNT_0038962183 /DNA_START=17 /DNA_END=931 /DNA_ORIENTATION=+